MEVSKTILISLTLKTKNMKTFVKIVLIIAILFVIWGGISLIYPNVVTELSPIRDPGEKAKVALRNVTNAKNQDSALIVAVNELPTEGNTLEERVAHWVRYDISKIDSMKFMLVSGVGISATDAKNKIHEGYTRHQVIVRIFSNGTPRVFLGVCQWPR